jgi:hypothetical protein
MHSNKGSARKPRKQRGPRKQAQGPLSRGSTQRYASRYDKRRVARTCPGWPAANKKSRGRRLVRRLKGVYRDSKATLMRGSTEPWASLPSMGVAAKVNFCSRIAKRTLVLAGRHQCTGPGSGTSLSFQPSGGSTSCA